MRKIEKQTQQNKEQQGENLQKRKQRIWLFLILFICIAIVGTILEKLLSHDVITSLGFRTLCGTILTGSIGILGKLAWTVCKDDPYLKKLREEDTLLEDLLKKVNRFVWKSSRWWVVDLVFLFFVFLVGTFVWVQCSIGSRTAHAMEAFIKNESPQNEESKEVEESFDQEGIKEDPIEISTSEPEPIQKEEKEQTEELEEETSKFEQVVDINALENELEEKAKKMKIETPTVDWTLPEEEWHIILFEEGDYQISTDWTPEQAKQKILGYIEYLEQEQLENEFDIFAPQTLRNEVAEASNKDKSVVTSTEKDKIITKRIDAYGKYLKKSLAKLIAEDFHYYALAYKHFNMDHEMMIMYYMQSLKWQYERLKYKDLLKDEQRKVIISIQYRYNDIMTYSDPGTEQWKRAKLLSDTYKLILEDYVIGEE